jgi:hypothetical protein
VVTFGNEIRSRDVVKKRGHAQASAVGVDFGQAKTISNSEIIGIGYTVCCTLRLKHYTFVWLVLEYALLNF